MYLKLIYIIWDYKIREKIDKEGETEWKRWSERKRTKFKQSSNMHVLGATSGNITLAKQLLTLSCGHTKRKERDTG